MKNVPNLSVIIPFYNEEKTLFKILQKVLKRKEVYEVIAVDDCSKDESVKALENFLAFNPEAGQKVQLIKHKTNLGKGAAIVSGLKKSKGKYTLIQDADLEYDPADYQKMLEPIIKRDAQFVIGNRWLAKQRGYLLAQLGNRYINFLTNLLFNCNFRDSYCGYKLGLTRVWKKLFLKSRGFEIEAEITGKLAKGGFKIIEVPIHYRPRTFSQGKKINWKDVVKGTFTLLQVRFKDGIYKTQ